MIVEVTEKCYGVQLNRKSDGKPLLAMGRGLTPQLFYWRKDALEFKRGLAANDLKGNVVLVEVKYSFEPKKP